MRKFKNNQEFFDYSVNLVVIPIADIVEKMKEHNIKLPLFAYRYLLKETIRDEVFEASRYKTYSDELQYRLRNYDMHSIFLLEKLIDKYELDFDLAKFKEMLFNFLYLNREKLEIKPAFFNQLVELAEEKELEIETLSYAEFYQVFEPRLYQTIGYIDGIHSEKWTDETLTSHTLGDLKNLGKKYGIKVPRRINKSRLIEILAAKLRLDDEEVEMLSKKSILDIEIYAKDKGFRISTDLKKRDMIEFIRFSLGMYHKEIQSDQFSYDFPIPQLEEALEEDLEEASEPEVEETVEDDVLVHEGDLEVEEEAELEKEEEPVIEPEPEAEPEIEEEIEEEVILEEDVEAEIEEDVVDEDFEETTLEEEEHLPEELADSELLTEEEKELLDEKIAYIINRYHKKKKRRKILKWTLLTLLFLIVAAAAYGYIHYTWISEGELPFNIPIFW